MHYLSPLFVFSFLSLFLLDSFIYSLQKGWKYTREYTGVYCHFYMTPMHILVGRNSTLCTFVEGESYRGDAYTKGEKTCFMRKSCCLVLPYACFLDVLWFFMVYALLLSLHRIYVLNLHTSLYLFWWSFALLCGHCSHFYMTVLVYDQVALIFHIMFTWSQFTCYIILVLLLLALPWGSNVFCASVLGYRYICSKFITAP